MYKISIVSKTLRIHDNPFLDSDLYIILIDKKDYGNNQNIFLDNILPLHINDLNKLKIEPILLKSYQDVKKILQEIEVEYHIFIDYANANMKLPFTKKTKLTYIPSWCLIDWTDKIELLQSWFMPEGLKNHKVFKNYVISNIRKEFFSESKKIGKTQFNDTYQIKKGKTYVPLPKDNLDEWIIKNLESKQFMKDKSWYKPNTSPSTSIKDNSDYLSDLHKTSKLSPFISLGVLSPLTAYNFFIGETVMGSSRDQILFREMFHACSQMPEFWDDTGDEFGQKYDWEDNKNEDWEKYINGNTGIEDIDWCMKQLKKEGWLHHLARHMVADYLTRGKLQIHWKFGMEWFKKTLVDHDKCVNRGNWMWLSGTAFSSKQRGYFHYGEKFITNKDKKLKVKK